MGYNTFYHNDYSIKNENNLNFLFEFSNPNSKKIIELIQNIYFNLYQKELKIVKVENGRNIDIDINKKNEKHFNLYSICKNRIVNYLKENYKIDEILIIAIYKVKKYSKKGKMLTRIMVITEDEIIFMLRNKFEIKARLQIDTIKSIQITDERENLAISCNKMIHIILTCSAEEIFMIINSVYKKKNKQIYSLTPNFLQKKTLEKTFKKEKNENQSKSTIHTEKSIKSSQKNSKANNLFEIEEMQQKAENSPGEKKSNDNKIKMHEETLKMQNEKYKLYQTSNKLLSTDEILKLAAKELEKYEEN